MEMTHETVIAHNVIEEAKKHGEVKAISLEIGELAHVPAPEFLECMERLVDWKISWKERPAVVKCSCGFSGHPKVLERGHDFFLIECPSCGEVPDVVDGKDITLLDVTVD